MNLILYYGLAVCFYVVSTNALAISEASKRPEAGYIYQPAPTPMFNFQALKHLDLGKRQASSTVETTLTVVVSPDSTCGFLSGSPGNAITCANGAQCSWELAHITAIVCGTAAHLQCFDRDYALNTESCDDVCQENTYNLLCTDRSAPYCGTYAYPSGIRAFKCSSRTMARFQSVSFTYNNQDDRTFSTTTLVLDANTPLNPTETDTSPTGNEEPTDTSNPNGSSEPKPTETTDTGGGGGGSKTNVGAIVGGSIGGFLVLSLLVLGVLWVLRKNRRNENPPPVQQVQPAVVPQNNIPQTPGDSVPPMNQNYPKPGVASPTTTEWHGSTMTAQSPGSPVSTWTGQYPSSAADQVTYQEMPGSPPYTR
ncbi:hypothetical protein ACHAO7_004191 [Fusarium culmorum]|uniref:Mid2 domain-containing protein n=1 Tax=Fusarium culmorum TaxID=5516 RepID=A0A2T4H222_FUSCU|nr:hypothetical protein FCULG_00007777 [Fusarium culmorum]